MTPFAPTKLLALIPGVSAFMKLAQDAGIARDSRYHEALDRLNDALSSTRSYVANLNLGQPESREKEEILSSKWYSASTGCSYFDSEFAERCMMKGAYWSEPSIWKPEDIRSCGIGLEEVSEEIRQFLIERKNG